MALATATRTTLTRSIPIWQSVHTLETAQGGFTLVTTGHTLGSVLKAGSPVSYDEATRLAIVGKVATLHANATNVATTYQVEKGHNLIVGDFVFATVGGKAYAITVIDTSNADYDIITVGTTLGAALTAPVPLYQGAASGATAGAFLQTYEGLLYEDTIVQVGTTISVVVKGTVYARRIPSSGTALRTALPNILFSDSY
jgi:hypothetical protein